MKKRFSDEQIISILREAEAEAEAEAGVSAWELCRMPLSTCRYDAQRPSADAHLSGVSLSWRLNADDAVKGWRPNERMDAELYFSA